MFTRDLLNLAVIEVELKEAASRRQRQWKGLLHNPPTPSSVQTFLETIGRLLFTFCIAVFLFQRYPWENGGPVMWNKSFFTQRIRHCGWINIALWCTNQTGHRRSLPAGQTPSQMHPLRACGRNAMLVIISRLTVIKGHRSAFRRLLEPDLHLHPSNSEQTHQSQRQRVQLRCRSSSTALNWNGFNKYLWLRL